MLSIEEKVYNTESDETVIVLVLIGRLDITTAWQLKLRLDECTNKSRRIFVNLEGVHFIDSSGLTCLVAGMRNVDKLKGTFRICNIHPDAKLVFEVTMMDTVFEICETEEEAFAIPF
ncbi:STAS domain-containing protein [Cylindrospermopsis raciborskii]|uniref:STAS domain-containing protein n=1 Tax=Cylindrospermopsis raciborskii TaxID=77022 RepID=UPI000778EFC1|nr:STAS domain-containing protein [Cylindrospermopsis raciborskii]MCZ2200660.1 STAS domain-containing protein [Cylindrospermopsis raciborskii PAMP2012]MCZ2205601.1 STAS domain-containing protein [Cylindrospermopsis raciborskii PAMP2011]